MKDLRDFIKLLQAGRELVSIEVEVDPILEISEITDRISKRGGPALLFRRPKGYQVPVLTNQFGSESRMASALRCSSLEDLAGRVTELTALEMPHGFADRLRALGRLRSLAGFGPRTVKEGPARRSCFATRMSIWDSSRF